MKDLNDCSLYEVMTIFESLGGEVILKVELDEIDKKVKYKQIIKCGNTSFSSESEIESYDELWISSSVKTMTEIKIDEEIERQILKLIEEYCSRVPKAKHTFMFELARERCLEPVISFKDNNIYNKEKFDRTYVFKIGDDEIFEKYIEDGYDFERFIQECSQYLERKYELLSCIKD